MVYTAKAHMGKRIKTTVEILSLIIFINISICLANIDDINYPDFPGENITVPSSHCNGDTKDLSLDISIYAATILIAVVGLVALIITFVTFIVPFILITTTDFQMAFFDTIEKGRFLRHVKNSSRKDEYIKTIVEISENVCRTARSTRWLALLILGVSFFELLVLTCFSVYSYFYYNFERILEIFVGFTIFETLFIVLIIVIYCYSIAKNNFRYKLARIQHAVIIDSLKNNDDDKAQKTDRSIDVSISEININLGKGGAS